MNDTNIKEKPQWKIPSDRIDNALILKPGGRVDGQNALEFQAAIDSAIDATNDSVILELSDLSYISSAGLRVILLLAKTLRSRNVQFSMCSISDTVKDVFEISGFGKIIPTHATRDDALASIK